MAMAAPASERPGSRHRVPGWVELLLLLTGALLLSVFYGDFSLSVLHEAVVKTLKVTVMILTILMAGNMFAGVFIAARLFHEGHRFDESYRICADHKFFAEHRFFEDAAYIPVPLIAFQAGGISSRRDFGRLHYQERRRMLRELGRSRPLLTEWYYWLRSHSR